MKKNLHLIRICTLMPGFLLCILTANAADKTWNAAGGAGGNWTTAGNWSPSGQPAAGDNVTISGDLSSAITNIPAISLNNLVINGSCNFQSNAGMAQFRVLTVTGNFTVAAGETFTLGVDDVGRLDFVLASGATGTISGTVYINSYDGSGFDRSFTNSGNLAIAAAGLINGQNTSEFILSAGATLQIGSTAGITNTGGTGNVRVPGTRTYTAGANYIYNGTAVQAVGNGLTQNNPASLTINNTAGAVSLGTNTTITGALTVIAGANLNLSTFSLGGATSLTLQTGTTAGSTISGTGTLTLAGNVTVNNTGTGANGATVSAPVALGATRTFTVADGLTAVNDLSFSAVVSGAAGVTKAGTGTMALTAANTYTGAVTVNAGVLSANTLANTNSNSSLGTGAGTATITLSGTGTLRYTGSGHSTNRSIDRTADGSVIDASGSGTMTLTGTTTGANNNLVLTGTGAGVLSGVIGSGNTTLTKNGTGTWTLSAANTFTGGATLNAGTLNIDNASALGTNAGTFTIAGGTINNTSGADITTVNYPLALNADFTYSGSVPRSLNLGTGAVTMSASRQITVSAATLTIGGIINDGTLNLTKAGAGTLSLGATAKTLNSLTISAGTLTASSGTMNLAGDLTNGGTFTHNSGLVNLNGTLAQTIGGAQPTTFNNLTVNKASAGVALGNDVNIAGAMQFTSGVVTSTSSNTLGFNDNATVGSSPAPSNSSYVDGPVIKRGNNDFTFPVGDPLGSYHPLRLVNTTGADGDIYTAEYFRASAAAQGTLSAGLFGVSNCEYWTMTRDAGVSTPNIFVSWTADSDCMGNQYVTSTGGLVVARLNGSVWQQANGGNVAASGTVGLSGNGSVGDNGISLFGTFALGNIAGFENPLPVTFNNVKAFEKGTGVQIEWSNLTEKDVANYIVERSANGNDFTAISQLSARSNQTDLQSYLSFDAAPLSGTNFYRIKVVEVDGKVIYSKLLRVDIGKIVKGITLYPNPVSGNEVTIGFSAAKGQYTLRIMNAAGQQVSVKQVIHPGGNVSQAVGIPATAKPGFYTMLISGDNFKESKTFVIQ